MNKFQRELAREATVTYHLRTAHDCSIMASSAIQRARDCREFCTRKGYPISPTVNRIIQQHVKNARKLSRAAIDSYRLAGRYDR